VVVVVGSVHGIRVAGLCKPKENKYDRSLYKNQRRRPNWDKAVVQADEPERASTVWRWTLVTHDGEEHKVRRKKKTRSIAITIPSDSQEVIR
jgi:hypothetical protein